MPLLIHPGFHKTGTSWLQQQLFTDQRFFNMLFDHQEIDALFISPHDLAFCADTVRRTLEQRRTEAPGDRIDVISSETLCGEMFTGSRLSVAMAERLAKTCDPAKILLTVRAQVPIARSIYMQYLKRGGRLPIEKFLTYRPQPSYGWFNVGVLQFGDLVRHYGALFGDDNVLVLPQELLAADRQAYVRYLVRFASGNNEADIPEADDRPREGVSPPASGIGLLRAANLFRDGPLNPNAIRSMRPVGNILHRAAYRWTWGEKAAHRELADTISRHISGRFAASNHILQAYCPVNLAHYGYEMEPSERPA